MSVEPLGQKQKTGGNGGGGGGDGGEGGGGEVNTSRERVGVQLVEGVPAPVELPLTSSPDPSSPEPGSSIFGIEEAKM